MRSAPQIPVAILGDGVHGIAWKSVFDCVGGEPAIVPPAQPAVKRPHPEAAVPVLLYRQDDVARESLRLAKDSELPGAQSIESAAVGANPKVSLAVFADRPHEVVRQSLFRREGREPAGLPDRPPGRPA